MRSCALLTSLGLTACAVSAEPQPPATTADGIVLHGQRPADTLGLPEFTVADHLGHARGPQDLLGRPQVLWFYPMAGTPG